MPPGKGLWPNAIYDKLTDINPIHFQGRPFCILDVDNTLVERKSEDILPETVAFLANLEKWGIIKKLCLVSNIGFHHAGRQRRVESIARKLRALHVFAHGWHSKPHPRPFQKALALLGSRPENTLVIGDQLFTDIRGGNHLGMHTILITPLGKDAWFTRPRRWLERWWRRRP